MFRSATPGARSAQRTLNVFCLQQQTVCALNDHCSANDHVSLINSNSSIIAHSLGDIEYFCVIKKTLWASPSLCAIANSPDNFVSRFVVCFRSVNVRCEQSFSRANGANVQQNVCCVHYAERAPVKLFRTVNNCTAYRSKLLNLNSDSVKQLSNLNAKVLVYYDYDYP